MIKVVETVTNIGATLLAYGLILLFIKAVFYGV